MASYYFKRGKTVSGPFSIGQIKQLDEQENLRADDLIADSKDGPWEKYRVMREGLLIGINRFVNWVESNPVARSNTNLSDEDVLCWLESEASHYGGTKRRNADRFGEPIHGSPEWEKKQKELAVKSEVTLGKLSGFLICISLVVGGCLMLILSNAEPLISQEQPPNDEGSDASLTASSPKMKNPKRRLVPMRKPVVIEFDTVREGDSRVKLLGRTNLPTGTNLMLGMKGSHQKHGHSDKQLVDLEGRFAAIFSNVQNGEYVAQVMMPVAFTQPKEIQVAIGKDGEHLKGRLLRQAEHWVVVERLADVRVSSNAARRTYHPLPETKFEPAPRAFTDEKWKEWMSDIKVVEKREHYIRIQRVLRESRTQVLSTMPRTDAEREDRLDKSDKYFLLQLSGELQVPYDYLRAVNAKGQVSNW